MRDIPESTNPTRRGNQLARVMKEGPTPIPWKRPFRITNVAKIQNAVLNPRPTLTLAHNTSPILANALWSTENFGFQMSVSVYALNAFLQAIHPRGSSGCIHLGKSNIVAVYHRSVICI
mgnify:CR=1 FL=1